MDPGPSLPETDIDEILRRKRKARGGHKACFPCAKRKVKCSYDSPCKNCVEREHPELCSYQPPSKRPNLGNFTNTPVDGSPTQQSPAFFGSQQDKWSPSKADWDALQGKLDRLERCLIDVKNEVKRCNGSKELLPEDDGASDENDSPISSKIQGINTNHDLIGENVYLGGNSVPAMVVALGKGDGGQHVQDLLQQSILPVFGLDNDTATYPFVDLWGVAHGSPIRIQQLCALLPLDSDCHQFFSYYKSVAHVLYPGIVDLPEFESDLTNFLITRSNETLYNEGDDPTSQKVYGKDLHWLGMLFAVLASGCQCSGRPRKERQLTSQVYVCCAYECLRIVNYLSHSNLHDIQNLLVLGNVISNNMNAGVAWSLLGLTIRLAMSQGLHQESPSSISPIVRKQRSNVWWQIIWQDSLLSITYDRASSTATMNNQPTYIGTPSEKWSYAQCMRELCKIGLEIVAQRANPRMSKNHELLHIVEVREKLRLLMDNASDHLRYTKQCRSMKDQLEHWNLYLHRSYVTSELCRPTINQRHTQQSDLAASLRKACIDSLADTVEAFMGLQNITQFASQSWAAVHRSLSSALLLSILREPSRTNRVRTLLSRLISVMSTVHSGIDPSEIAAPISRSLEALRKLVPEDVSPGSLSTIDESQGSVVRRHSDEEFMTAPNSAASTSPHWNWGSEDTSPYTLMDNILWGDNHLPPQI